jgi:hypothetical protein
MKVTDAHDNRQADISNFYGASNDDATANDDRSDCAVWKLNGLDRLPLEKLDCIFARLERCEDLFRLGRALPHLWPLVWRHIEARRFLPYLGRWASTRLVCLGTHLPTGCAPYRYPPGLLTTAHLAELEHGLGLADGILAHAGWASRRWPRDVSDGVAAEAAAPTFVKGDMGFGAVVLVRTSWTVGDELLDRDFYGLECRRGTWAGHWLDITTAERHPEQLARTDAAWRVERRDESDEVAVETKHLWDRYHPGDPYDRQGIN